MPRIEPTVFIVDDDEAVRNAIALLMRSVGLPSESFASAPEFLAAWDPERPGCLVLDIRMGGMSGIDVQKELAARRAILPIIFVTGHGDVAMAVRAMQDGAVDFVEKPFRDQGLLDRIHRAIRLDGENRRTLEERESIRDRLGALTPREREIMRRVVHGEPNKAIAFDLGISERTVEVHRSRVMEKMKATSLPHLVRMALTAENDGAGA